MHADPRDNFTSQQQMLARFNASRNFAWVARRVDAETATRVRELNLKGVYLQKEFKRFYPNNDLAAQVLGYVGTDDIGLGGLERQFDDDMHGVAGHMVIGVDAKRQALTSEESQPMPGENLVLSIDANIQYMAERALDAQMEKMKARTARWWCRIRIRGRFWRWRFRRGSIRTISGTWMRACCRTWR